MNCRYVPGDFIKDRFPRRRYTTDCNFQFVTMHGQIWNRVEGHKINHPSGKCMKCNKEIEII